MAAPRGYAAHLSQDGYHPRSNKHSNRLCELVVTDLLESCPKLAEHAKAGEIVYDLNFKHYDAFIKRICTRYTERF